MKRRMLALVLALVLMVGMLPTVFATDAVEPAAVGEELDTENPADDVLRKPFWNRCTHTPGIFSDRQGLI